MEQSRDAAFESGFVHGQFVTYAQQVRMGAKLAAQLGCHSRHVKVLRELARAEKCRLLIDRRRGHDRVAVWIFSRPIARKLILAMNKRSHSVFDMWAMGKLLGYANIEIEKFCDKRKS